ncbi:hypothetical protein CLF_100204 [Clonorchis sinensis]|uniref:Uncharacterized protein n=1 Tax=Clonorchis sinensis TaxID=79923 RepID=G7Y2X5_CLOSI|nr:hypothetical protein CLF_100204 [Clonorchis sinensis]
MGPTSRELTAKTTSADKIKEDCISVDTDVAVFDDDDDEGGPQDQYGIEARLPSQGGSFRLGPYPPGIPLASIQVDPIKEEHGIPCIAFSTFAASATSHPEVSKDYLGVANPKVCTSDFATVSSSVTIMSFAIAPSMDNPRNLRENIFLLPKCLRHLQTSEAYYLVAFSTAVDCHQQIRKSGRVRRCYDREAYPTQDWRKVRTASMSGIKTGSDLSKAWTNSQS